MTNTSDLTLVYYTDATNPEEFQKSVQRNLVKVCDSAPIVTVSKRPYRDDFGEDYFISTLPRNHFNIYRDALMGAKLAKTKYIALCEDDTLYSPQHFQYRPKNKPFAYNLGYWGIYTWQDPPIYNYKGRKNLGNLICERQAFIDAMEERFAKHPNIDPDNQALKDIWAEPGKYEDKLRVHRCETEDFYTNPPNIKFSHENELSFAGLGTRKRAGELRATEIPYWGRADKIRKLYD